jgi:uncharacterized membrane protein HdeD (DUF308 family)
MSPKDLARDMWGALLLRGVLAVLFGIAAVFWPALTLVTLVYLFSAYVLITGLANVIQSLLSMKVRSTWFLTLLVGLVELGVGVYLLRHPDVSFATFILLAGFALIIRGVLEVVGAFLELTNWATSRTLLTVSGLASVLAGVIVLMQPVAGGVAFVWVLGVYALLAGAMMIAVALDARALLENKR